MSQKPNNTTDKPKKNKVFFFEIERFISRVLRNWIIYAFTLLIAVSTAYYVNTWYFNRIYLADSTFHVSSRSSGNTDFGSNSINFIWGGSGGKIDILTKILLSRTHALEVAKRSNAYIAYKEEGTLKKSNSYYNISPFHVEVDTTRNQIIGVELEIKEIDKNSFQIVPLSSENSNVLYNYRKDSVFGRNIKIQFPKQAKFNEWITSDNYRFKITRGSRSFITTNKYSFILTSLDQATSRVASGTLVKSTGKGSSILQISKTAFTQEEAIDIVNISLDVLRENELEEKNEIAKRTMLYLSEQLGIVKEKVDSSSLEYQNLQKNEKIYNFSSEKGEILTKVKALETERLDYQEKINLLNSVSQNVYQVGSRGMIDLQIIGGLTEGNFTAEVNRLRQLEVERENLRMLYKEGSREILEIDNQIERTKNSIQHLIGISKNKLQKELNLVNSKLAEFDSKASLLPEKEKKFMDVERGFAVNDALYNQLLSRYSMAELTIASNISDITVIDKAKFLGQAPISPDKKANMMLAILLGLAIPTAFLLGRELLDTKIKGIPDIIKTSGIPFLGTIGNSDENQPVVVLSQPKSSVSESFRALRSNLQFLYKNSQKSENKTIMVTSSIGGEGKTFVSMNLATVLAISGKKTILLGMDLRKPKIFNEFNLTNKKGLSNYLSGNSNLDEVIQKTKVDTLDIIIGGPIPPNPAELLLSDTLNELIQQLKSDYDFIVLDTPPVILVADALELMKYADATLYISRFNYTYRGLLQSISDKYTNGEVHNIGIILNDFKVKGSYGYGYGYGYGYEYGYGYFAEDEDFDPTFIGKIKRILKLNRLFKSKK